MAPVSEAKTGNVGSGPADVAELLVPMLPVDVAELLVPTLAFCDVLEGAPVVVAD